MNFKILFILLLLLAIPVLADNPYQGYQIHGVAVIDFHDNTIYLADGTNILLDSQNVSRYQSQVTRVVNVNGAGISQPSPVSVNNTLNQTYVQYGGNILYNQTWQPAERIWQGQCVALNHTIDISGMGWNSGAIAWYGRYYDALSPYTNETPAFSLALPYDVAHLSEFYIDPSIFVDKLGFWYMQYSSDEWAGNSRMFYVNYSCPAPNLTVEQAVVGLKKNETPLYPLPKKHEDDILLARNDGIVLNTSNPTSWWLFGFDKQFSFYDRPSQYNLTIIDPSDMANSPPGDYVLDIISAGANGILEETWNENWSMIESPFRAINPVQLVGSQPPLVRAFLEQRVSLSLDDILIKYKMSFQEPAIQVMRIDQSLDEYNYTVLDIKGYTNVQNNTMLTFRLDPNKIGGVYHFNDTFRAVTITDGDPGDWRQFEVWHTIIFKDIFPGQHYLEITAPQGADQYVPFYIFKELPSDYIPPTYINYVGNSPFIPTPTPEIVTKEVTHEVTVTITIPVTPSQESVNEAQWNADVGLVLFGLGVFAVLGIIGYFVVAFVRAAKRRNE
jgi:hypothetical protein